MQNDQSKNGQPVSVGSTVGSALNCRERINDYLSAGGLFNPEQMEHEKVRALLLDCREEIMELQLARDRYHMDRDIWKWRAEKAEAVMLCAENEARHALEDIVRGDYAEGAERAGHERAHILQPMTRRSLRGRHIFRKIRHKKASYFVNGRRFGDMDFQTRKKLLYNFSLL